MNTPTQTLITQLETWIQLGGGDLQVIEKVRDHMIHQEWTIAFLNDRVRELEKHNNRQANTITEMNWRNNPDRSGGCWTADEIRNGDRWI